MELKLHELKTFKGAKKKKKRVGRGFYRGTYSGRGQKGQRARSGGKKGLKKLGIKMMAKRIPKLKGFKSLKEKFEIVNLKDLEKKFEENEVIDIERLLAKNLIKRGKKVKILGKGKLTKKFVVKAHAFSKKAKEEIEKIGGQAMSI